MVLDPLHNEQKFACKAFARRVGLMIAIVIKNTCVCAGSTNRRVGAELSRLVLFGRMTSPKMYCLAGCGSDKYRVETALLPPIIRDKVS